MDARSWRPALKLDGVDRVHHIRVQTADKESIVQLQTGSLIPTIQSRQKSIIQPASKPPNQPRSNHKVHNSSTNNSTSRPPSHRHSRRPSGTGTRAGSRSRSRAPARRRRRGRGRGRRVPRGSHHRRSRALNRWRRRRRHARRTMPVILVRGAGSPANDVLVMVVVVVHRTRLRC